MDTLYKEEILEHYQDPHHFGHLVKPTHTSSQHNPFCGDDVSVEVIAADDKIIDIAFSGQGCAISIAAASILMDYSLGKSISELTRFSQDDMLKLLGIPVSETRKKCALLAYATLQDIITNIDKSSD